MAIKIGIIGIPNSGKSYSRKTIVKGEEVFVLAPSHKSMHITTSDDKPIKKAHFENKAWVSGNWTLVKTLPALSSYLKYISNDMPQIKTIIVPDFTHFISRIIADKGFISRKAGGEAFQRFWELAADTLNNFILSIDDLRDDLLVVTEYHAEYSEIEELYKIKVPGGKMLEEKFLLDSYYDNMYYTHVARNDQGEVEGHYFVTRKWDRYNARSGDLFKDLLIPNDLQMVLDKTREDLGI